MIDPGAARRPRHVVWDFNGTLVDDHEAVIAAVNDALARLGLPAVDADTYRTHFTRPLETFYRRVLGRALAPAEWAELDEAFHAAYRARFGAIRLAADAERALALARTYGAGQSLLSMWRHDDLVPRVAALGIAGWFGRVDGLRWPDGGSKAGHLAAHLDALRLPAARAVVIGDTLDDAAAAATVGAACVLYDGGSHHRAALEASGLPVAGSLVAAVEASGLAPGAAGDRG